MSFDQMIDEHKKKSNLLNNLIIDLQYIIDLLPQVFNKNLETDPKFKDACDGLITLCNRSEIQLKELKRMIPSGAAEVD